MAYVKLFILKYGIHVKYLKQLTIKKKKNYLKVKYLKLKTINNSIKYVKVLEMMFNVYIIFFNLLTRFKNR